MPRTPKPAAAPPKTRHILRTVFITLAVLVATALVTATVVVERAHPGAVDYLNHGPNSRALIVYQPGLTDFERKAAQAFGIGLVNAGWTVESVAASGKAPTDLTEYRLIVVSAPAYWWSPARPVPNWISSTQYISGKPVVVLTSDNYQGGRAGKTLAGDVRKKGGVVQTTVTVHEQGSWDNQFAKVYAVAIAIKPPVG